jgi:UDP-N-acetylglucosamine diphosphorylase/glucosamine-1-phosphate N-acetyltransferase
MRVHQALAAAGLRDISLVHEDTSHVPGGELWASIANAVAAGTPGALARLLAGRALLVVRGDLPLLTEATVRAFLRVADAGQPSDLFESSGAMAVFHAGDRAERFLASLVQHRAEPLLVDSSRTTWRAAEVDDIRRLVAPSDYSDLSDIARRRKLALLAAAGVLIADAARAYVDDAVAVGSRTTLLPGSHLKGDTSIGSDCTIGPDAWIESSAVEDRVVVRYSVVEGARVREGSTIGPFAHLRHGSDIGPDARVGNFVEVKASRLGAGVKVGHLAYLGDADVGAGTNVGAGAITCNYDGNAKHRTVVGSSVFVGSNVSLVAPVTIGDGALLAAGSTITDDVPPESLAIARARQVTKKRKQTPPREET